MDRAVLTIYIIVALAIVGLIITADNEPTPTIIKEKEDKPHLVDTIPGHRSTHNVTVIKNTDAIISGG